MSMSLLEENAVLEVPSTKILVVDDRQENLIAMKKILEKINAEVHMATSGNEGLGKMLRHDFALVLLDVSMPEMDGIETAELMRAHDKTKKIPIIFVTALNREDQLMFKGYETGAVDYLFKPIDTNVLLGKVSVFLELYRHKKHVEEMLERVKRVVALEESNSELEEFARIVAHDLKQPLRGMTSYAEFILSSLGDSLDEDNKEKLRKIIRLGEHASTMMESLLEYSRVGHVDLAMKESNLNDVVHGIVDSLEVMAEEQNAKIILESKLPTLVCDAVRVGEVFRNLITNAIKYNDSEKKCIEIGMKDSVIRKDETGQAVEEHQVFYVRDNGIGMKPELIPEIFKMFRRLHSGNKYGGGEGIGMALVKRIIDRHKGHIWIESTEGKGSCFYFTLAA